MNSISYIRFFKGQLMAFIRTLLVLFSFANFCFGQEEFLSRISPLALATAHYKNTYVRIIYSQPQKKGREIFGNIVPYEQIWRTGANEATEITTTGDIMVNNQLLKAGTYSLFTIPGKEKWTIIFNADVGLLGSYNYNPKTDVLRFDVPAKFSVDNGVTEVFTIRIDQKVDTAELFFLWDKTQVSFPIQFIDSKP